MGKTVESEEYCKRGGEEGGEGSRADGDVQTELWWRGVTRRARVGGMKVGDGWRKRASAGPTDGDERPEDGANGQPKGNKV